VTSAKESRWEKYYAKRRRSSRLPGVSRTSDRDILKEVEEEKIIPRGQKKGVGLRLPSPREITKIFDIRVVLNDFALRQAIDRVAPADLKTLGKISHRYD
jgi:DNA-binding GntR family transcriptional regulator